MTNGEALWPIEPLPGAHLVAVPRRRGFHIRPLWLWRWKRIGLCIGLPLYTIGVFVIVGWGGPK